jgi:hypothetical protein
MGLVISSLNNFPYKRLRDYYVYLLEYGFDDPVGSALMDNFWHMAKMASKNKAVVIAGSADDRFHFANEVLSFHNINGENADEILPAILITNRPPDEFKEYDGQGKRHPKDCNLILIPLKRFCKDASEVAALIQKIFTDIEKKKDLSEFRVAKEMKGGIGKAIVDSIILEPNFSGIGFSFNKLAQQLRRGSS